MPRSCRIVGNMKRMPLEDHRKQNDTIHSSIVRFARSAERSSKTVTPVETATSGLIGSALISSADKARPSACCSICATVCSASAILPLAEEIAHRFGHVAAHEEEQHRRDNAHYEQAAPAKSGNNCKAEQRSHYEPDEERRQDISGHAPSDAARTELGGERRRHRHL